MVREKMNNTNVNQPHRGKGRFVYFLLGCCLFIAAILVVKHWVANKPEKKLRPQIKSLPFVEVMPISLSSNSFKVNVGGFVSAKTTAKITPQVSGKIIRLSPKLQVGNTLKKGTLLAQIGITDYTAKLAQAKANLATAESHYIQAQAVSRQAHRDIKRLGLKATELNLKTPQLAAAKAAVENAKAQVTLAKIHLNQTTINVPFDATVQSRGVSQGEVAGINTVLATLNAIDTYVVKLSLDKRAMKKVVLGDMVRLTDSVYGSTYEGQIVRFSSGLDPKNRTLSAFVEINNPTKGETPLLLDSYLSGEIIGKQVDDSALIPTKAIVENRFVWSLLPNNTIQRVPIHLISYQADEALVRFETVFQNLIIRPKATFIDGQTVTTSSAVKKRRRQRGKADNNQQPNKKRLKKDRQTSARLISVEMHRV